MDSDACEIDKGMSDAYPRIAVVCRREQNIGVKKIWPDAVVVHPGQAIMGHRFDQIIMLWSPTDQQRHQSPKESETAMKAGMDWYENHLLCRLKPGGEMVWLA